MARWAKKVTENFTRHAEGRAKKIAQLESDLAGLGTPRQEAAKFIGTSAKGLGTFVKNNTVPTINALNTKTGYAVGITGGVLLAPTAYARGEKQAEYEHKVNQITDNMEASNDGGGTFLRPNFQPRIDDHAATGELVFAMRSLRNGG